VGGISKEVLGDKENCPRGRPSKLSSCNQHSIIRQIRSGRLDNAVQVTQFINSTVTTSVTPQTVRNVLKKSGFYSATKKKVPMLKKTHRQKRLEFAHYHENWTVEDSKRVLWSDETKIN
jgi:Transposase